MRTDQWQQHSPRLRIEAAPAQWSELDSPQRQAYRQLAQMIVEAIREMPSPDAQVTPHETMRRTRTAFVTGGRGAGKTTVLTSLIRDSLGSPRDNAFEGKDIGDPDANGCQSLVNAMRGHVVWLETLDMEPLPQNANLMASILARLEDATKRHGTVAGSVEPRGLLEPSSEYHTALLELQRLQTDVALAWDGNLEQRQGQIDPDAFAVEMMRTERARLSINTKFTETLRGLAKHVFRNGDLQDPLFILPVDDFDLNPPNCLDLLRVLRLISVPRLFTIVLGDLEVASTVLTLKLSNDIGTIANPSLSERMLGVDSSTVGALAGDVAANALRKLLPPGQRLELSPMALDEALNFRPLGTGDETPRLEDLLCRCVVSLESAPEPAPSSEETDVESGTEADIPQHYARRQVSLRELLLSSGLPPLLPSELVSDQPEGSEQEEATVPRSQWIQRTIYSGTQFLLAPPRHIADTWLALHEITAYDRRLPPTPQEVSEPLLAHFASVAQAGLQETPAFRPDERTSIRRAIERNNSGAWTLRPLPLAVIAEATVATTYELQHAAYAKKTSMNGGTRPKRPSRASGTASPRAHIVAASSTGWEMAIVGDSRWASSDVNLLGTSSDLDFLGRRRPLRTLPESAVAALILYHDLLTFAVSGSCFITPLLTRANLHIRWATTEWQHHQPVAFAWPAPPARTFLQLDLFGSAWNQAITANSLTEATTPEQRVERLAFAWLAAGTAICTRSREPVRMTQLDADVPWDALAQRLKTMATEAAASNAIDGSRGAEYREWLLRVLELLMPEMGLPLRELAKRFKPPEELSTFWRQSHVVIQQRRAERLARIAEVDRDLAEQLRTAETGMARGFVPEPERLAALLE